MMASYLLEAEGNQAVRTLRLEKLRSGMPFMINSSSLPGEQCYLEYPSGAIKLVMLSKFTKEFIVIRELSLEERNAIRLRYGLE